MIQRTAIYIYKRVLYFKLGRLPLLKNFVQYLNGYFRCLFNEVITKESLITNKKKLLNQMKRKKNRNYTVY